MYMYLDAKIDASGSGIRVMASGGEMRLAGGHTASGSGMRLSGGGSSYGSGSGSGSRRIRVLGELQLGGWMDADDLLFISMSTFAPSSRLRWVQGDKGTKPN